MITLIQPFVILTLGDMTLKYDRGMSAVHVLLHAKKFIGKTQGLCGNYNSKSADDLVLRQGRFLTLLYFYDNFLLFFVEVFAECN